MLSYEVSRMGKVEINLDYQFFNINLTKKKGTSALHSDRNVVVRNRRRRQVLDFNMCSWKQQNGSEVA